MFVVKKIFFCETGFHFYDVELLILNKSEVME